VLSSLKRLNRVESCRQKRVRLLHNGSNPDSLGPLKVWRRRLGMRTFARCLIATVYLALLPVAASAQTSTIAGTVRDTSGAVLPGVTVEAGSPALIEKVRSATTDGAGQYKIIQLRPGTYTVTFTLPGFQAV